MTLIMDHPPRADQGEPDPHHMIPEVVLATAPESPDWKVAEAVEAEVFIKEGYVTTKEELDREEAPYLPKTEMTALTLGGLVIGATRLYSRVEGVGPYGFKTLNDAAAGRLELDERGQQIVDSMDLDRTLEVGTIALLEEYRGIHGFKLVGYLYEFIYNKAVAEGYSNVIASFDRKFFAGFYRRFAPAVTALGPAHPYIGSPTIPAHIDVATIDPTKFH